MEKFTNGPEWPGINTQPIQDSSTISQTPSHKKSSEHNSVKSKLRQLAELRSRSKEFGSNDSLYLTPLNRSLSDPWLLKGDTKKSTDGGLDLSKTTSMSNDNLKKDKVRFKEIFSSLVVSVVQNLPH